MMKNINKEDISIEKIIKALMINNTKNDLDLKFLLDALAVKLTRRQAIILRLVLLDNGIKQVEIAKMLGYSAPTINIEMHKIKIAIAEVKKLEGKNYFKYIKKRKSN